MKIHRRYSHSQKVKVADYARLHGLRPAERKFGVHRRNIDRWKKIRVSEFKKGKLRKTFNRKGQGRKLSYPYDVDDELVQWELEMRDLQLAVSSEMIKNKAKVVITPHVSTFKASNGWLEKFLRLRIVCDFCKYNCRSSNICFIFLLQTAFPCLSAKNIYGTEAPKKLGRTR